MADITMPRLSDTMSEGAVGRWLKKPGDKVQKDEVIAEIETDKATMDLVSFEDGTLQEIVVPEGKIVPIGEVIGIIGNGPAKAAPKKDAKGAAKAADAKPADAKADAKSAEAPKEAAAKDASAGAGAVKANGSAGAPTSAPASASAKAGDADEDAGPQLVARDGERIKASPVARRVAEEHGLDIRTVPGTGPGGRILRANVEEFAKKGGAPAAAKPAASAPAALPKGEVTPLSRIRKAVAKAMVESKPGVPHIYLTVEIDMGPAMALRKQINESGAAGVNISPNDLIVKAVARALTKHPWLNASYATTPEGQPRAGRQGCRQEGPRADRHRGEGSRHPRARRRPETARSRRRDVPDVQPRDVRGHRVRLDRHVTAGGVAGDWRDPRDSGGQGWRGDSRSASQCHIERRSSCRRWRDGGAVPARSRQVAAGAVQSPGVGW
jgi:pyruvate dehydrogenase E2 component (dihydrolipoamide acetyltransferase)